MLIVLERHGNLVHGRVGQAVTGAQTVVQQTGGECAILEMDKEPRNNRGIDPL